jgi:hypothetical protein
MFAQCSTAGKLHLGYVKMREKLQVRHDIITSHTHPHTHPHLPTHPPTHPHIHTHTRITPFVACAKAKHTQGALAVSTTCCLTNPCCPCRIHRCRWTGAQGEARQGAWGGGEAQGALP